MNTYSIYKKSPATRWYKIHTGFSQDQVINFMSDIDPDHHNHMASYINDGGDLIEYKAEPEQ